MDLTGRLAGSLPFPSGSGDWAGTALALFLAAGLPGPAHAGPDPATHDHARHDPAAHQHAAHQHAAHQHAVHDHTADQHAAHDHAGHHAVTAVDENADEAAPAKRRGGRWGADYFPNVPLVTHEGETVRFFDDLIEDKVVAINLVYTSCPNMCPLATARLARVQELLGDRVGRDIFMYSITIDPENDTPEKLKAHAEKFNVGPGWLFLTGKADDIMVLRKKLGFLIDGVQVELNDHNGAVLIGNQRTGQWMKRMATDSPYILAAQIGSWLSNWRTPNPQRANYASAPELRAPSMGENLFRTRCAACHTIGNVMRTVAGADTIEAGDRLGPDLLGIAERRSREWLVRWIKNPSQMLEDEDPVALALYAAYGNVTMPNFRLSDIEVEALLDYIREESDRIRGSAPEVQSSRNDDGQNVETRL